MKKTSLAVLLGATLLSSAAFAVEEAAPQAVPVISGGVGENSSAAIKAQEDNYSVKLVFTGEGGMYLSDVNVSILDRQGNEVVNKVSRGPVLLAGLEKGQYTVQATAEGHSKKQTISVKDNSLKTYHMRFPIKDDDTAATLPESKTPEVSYLND